MNELMIAIAMVCQGHSNAAHFSKPKMQMVEECNKRMVNCLEDKAAVERKKGLMNQKDRHILYIECINEGKIRGE